jgi:hypothetical protein
MTQKDRSEVREMLSGILSGHAVAQLERDKAAEKREVLINISLNNIDSHLSRLNGKVAEHEKVININLPHTMQHCPQAETIKVLQDASTGEAAIEKAKKAEKAEKHNDRVLKVMIIALIITLVIGLASLYFNIRSNKKNDVIITKQDDMGIPVIINPRGESVSLPEGYQLKMYPKDYMKDTIK